MNKRLANGGVSNGMFPQDARYSTQVNTENAAPPVDDITLIPFGEPESVLASNPANYLGIFLHDDDYYLPPVSQTGLAQISKANPHHGRAGHFKKNLLIRDFIKNNVLNSDDLTRAALDYLFLGNCYFQVQRNALGQVIKYTHLPAVRMRRRPHYQFGILDTFGNLIRFKPGEVVHLFEYDLSQQIYGIPPWFGAINSILLNEDATLFRRKYYRNGAHMGYILMTMDPRLREEDENRIKEQIHNSKGAGNFRSMYINIPANGNADKALTLIPVGEMKTQADWDKVKDASRNDILSAWGLHTELAGVMPESLGSGDLDKIVKLNYDGEIRPLQMVFEKLNDYVNGSPISFKQPEKETVE